MAENNTPQRNAHLVNTSIGKSPRRSLSTTRNIVIPDVVNDDDAERARRRSCSELRKRVSNIGVINRINIESENDSGFMSDVSLEDHYHTCVKLFAENKINTTNAWNLHIIEFMRSMLRKGTVMESNSLRIASTSLDIGCKVYGLRVDDIHTNIYKLACNMARINMEMDEEKVPDNDDNDEDQNNDEENNKKDKLKKGKGKRKTAICDDEDLNLMIAKSDNAISGKITPHNTQSYGAGLENGQLFTVSMYGKHKDGFERLVPGRTNFKFWTPLDDGTTEENQQENGKEEEEDRMVDIDIPPSTGSICPSFADFIIDQWSPDDDDVPLDTSRSTNGIDRIVYDANGFPVPELDSSIIEDADNYFNPTEINLDACKTIEGETEIAVGHRGTREPVAFITDMRPGDSTSSFQKPLQYWNNNAHDGSDVEDDNISKQRIKSKYEISCIWAGPSHWKIKCLRSRASPASDTTDDTVNSDGTVVSEPKQRRQRRLKIEPEIISFTDVYNSDYEKKFKSKKKVIRTRLAPDAIDRVTLPMDYGIVRDTIRGLMLRPWVKLTLNGKRANNENIDVNLTTAYNYDNPHDSEYCSQNAVILGEDDYRDDDADRHDLVPDIDDGDLVENAADGAVNALTNNSFQNDFTVTQSQANITLPPVTYAKRAKKMDMKKLKNAMAKTMVEINNNMQMPDETETEKAVNEPLKDVSFLQVYKNLPGNISSTMNEELSVPLAFVALLHLANENTLKLTQDNLNDFKISSDKPNPNL